MAWGIQTVYLPRENISFLEEWLRYHTLLGAEFFYLYDNTGSTELDLGNSVAVNGRNKYGRQLDFSKSDQEIADIEYDIIRKYPVTKIKWQPRKDGKNVYGQVLACDDFAKRARGVWCAFIDIDEFLVPNAPMADLLFGGPLKIMQKKFPDRWIRNKALEDCATFSINTEHWAPKLIINTADYRPGGGTIHLLRSNDPPRLCPLDELRFNHYNHNAVNHQWLLENANPLDPSWNPLPFEAIFSEHCEKAMKIYRQGIAACENKKNVRALIRNNGD